MYFITGCDASICIYHMLNKTQQYFCDLKTVKLKFHNGWKIWYKKTKVTEKSRARQKNFVFKEYWQQTKLNKWSNTKGNIYSEKFKLCNYTKADFFFFLFFYLKTTHLDGKTVWRWCTKLYLLCKVWNVFMMPSWKVWLPNSGIPDYWWKYSHPYLISE